MKTVLLFSGGMDSTTLLGLLKSQGDEVLCVSFKYGSMHESAEGHAALQIARHYLVAREIVTISEVLWAGGKSALLNQADMPQGEYQDAETEGPSSTVVPFRNAVMLSHAVAMAEARGYDQVAIANHANDYAHWAYPDCSPEFIGAFTAATYAGTAGKVRLMSPFMYKTKEEIVKLAHNLMVPLGMTWSCYRGGAKHCGRCPTCVERISAFVNAGYIDPVGYIPNFGWGANLKEF